MQESQLKHQQTQQSCIENLALQLLQQAGIKPTPKLLSQINLYIEQLQTWNKSINLTGIHDPEELLIKHLGDTLLLLPYIPDNAQTLLDIGSGAGVPGLILKLLRPELKITLVEATRKKVSFLKTVIFKLGLSGIVAEHGRIGDQGVPKHKPPKGFDVITARALTSLELLIDLAIPLLASHGKLLAMKGPKGMSELKASQQKLQQYGLIAKAQEAKLPILGHKRVIIEVEKK